MTAKEWREAMSHWRVGDMTRSERQTGSEVSAMKKDQGSASLCGLSKVRTCWKHPRFQALDAAALYFNLFGLFCRSSSTMQLAPLESPSLTKGEGDFQGYVYILLKQWCKLLEAGSHIC